MSTDGVTNWQFWEFTKQWGSFTKLSAKTGINPTLISKIVNGWRQPTKQQLDKICEAMSCTAQEIGF